MNLNPKNLQEYVVAKIIEYNDERDKEIEKLKVIQEIPNTNKNEVGKNIFRLM